jgi:gliding motility-associated-like protein
LPALTQLYIDGAVTTDAYSYEYQVTGLNACLDAVSSDVHNSILLEGSKKESDNTIDLVWNNYIGWKQGVQRYEVWRKLDDESSYTFYADAGLDTSISFESGVDGFVHCFRVLAFEDFGNQEISWSNELCLEFEHLLVIPNVITPNGNGWNDTWHIENIEYYPRCIVEIYNRWGMKLFTSVGYPVEWDGTYHGKDLPVGVYYYVIDIIVEGVEPYTGSVSILHRGK